MGVKNAHTSVRSHTRQSGSKAQSIWLRFAKGRNQKEFAGSVYYSFSGRARLWLMLFYLRFLELAQEGGGIGKGVGIYLSRRLLPSNEFLTCLANGFMT